MAISVADNFSYLGTKPLDARISFDTVSAMASASEATLYDGCFAYVKATQKYYSYDSTNEVDPTTGKWREYSSGGGGGASDYPDLTNKPSINGVELLGNKEVGLLSGNIHVDYTKLTNTPSINGVALTGNKTSSDLHIGGSGITTTTLWTNDGTHSDAYNGPFTMSADITTFDAVKFIFKSNTEYMEQTVPSDVITDMIANETSVCASYISADASGAVSSWKYQTTCLVRLKSATALSFYIMWSNAIVKLKLWKVIGINY